MIQPDNNLLKRYLDGSCSEKEQAFIDEWLEAAPSHAERIEFLAAEGRVEHDINISRFSEQVLHKVSRREFRGQEKRDKAPYRYRSPQSASSWHWVAAAVIALISVVGGMYYYQMNVPGSQAPVFVTKTMPPGQVGTLTLSDGSTIKLNSGSTLRYPRRFTGTTRDVFLSGEAFFQVAQDTTRPFTVHAGNLTTHVLGTAFNIKAYDGDLTLQVAVTEGKVAVKPDNAGSSPAAGTSVVLNANEWASYDTEKKTLEKKSGDISSMVAWTNGILHFDRQSLPEVARQLERWYGVAIDIRHPRQATCVISGKHKDENLENVLKSLKFATGVSYTMSENKVIMEGGRCK